MVILALSLVRVQQLGAAVEELGHEQVERLQLALRWRSNIAVNATRVPSIAQTDGTTCKAISRTMGSTTADTTKVQQRYHRAGESPGGRAFRKNCHRAQVVPGNARQGAGHEEGGRRGAGQGTLH